MKTKTKVKMVTVGVLVGITAFTIFHYKFMAWVDAHMGPETYNAIKTNSPTPLEQTQQLIDSLAANRETDETFVAETTKMQKELDQKIIEMKQALVRERKAQAKIDALFIMKTGYEKQISELEASTK